MEPVLIVRVRAPVASFRRPLDHNYQRTLPMPPPTTLIGIASAALGLSDRDLWAPHSPLRNLKVSVCMEEEPGRARDMWTVLKIKNARIEARSPYFRELLFFTAYTLLYGGDEQLLYKLHQAFQDPAYPLSLGREDELLWVEEILLGEAKPGEPRFRGTIVPGDVRQMPSMRPILEAGAVFEPPVVETLPLSFSVDSRGIRQPEKTTTLSFLPLGAEIEVPGLEARWWQGKGWVWLTGESH